MAASLLQPAILLLTNLILLAVTLQQANAQTRCQNGATYNVVDDICKCTPDFYGEYCETSFSSSDPCTSISIRELSDAAGSHSPENYQPCSATGCIDFSAISPGWYRLRSPAGGYLAVGCPGNLNSCGSSKPFIVTSILQETNANRQLYSAYLRQVTQEGPVCYKSTSISYPVRYVACGSFNLYYLSPTGSATQHYCIGSKKKCMAGRVSTDGSGYEPCFDPASCIPTLKSGSELPVMKQLNIKRSSGKFYDSLFNCTVRDSFQSNISVLHKVFYRLTYTNNTKKIIDSCNFTDIRIESSGSTTVSCNAQNFVLPDSNHYGGTVECVVQARCDSSGSEYISQELASVAHRFEFEYSLLNSETSVEDSTITPSKPIKLCINISKFPSTEKSGIQFRVSARRRVLMAKDKIELMVSNTSYPNDTDLSSSDPCVISMTFMLSGYTKACAEFRLLNKDEEGLIPYGLDGSQLAPMVEVSLSYRYNFEGVPSTTVPWVRLQSRQLIVVNFTSLYADEIKDYFHVYSDPLFKPANTENFYWTNPELETCRILALMKNNIIPFEVQAKECRYARFWDGHPAVVDVAIRYDYYIIRINSKSGKFSYSTKLMSGKKSGIPLKSDGVPRGVTVELTDKAVRVKLDIYGTIMYFWGFMTYTPGIGSQKTCFYNFIQSRAAMNSFDPRNCPELYSPELIDGYNMIDTMIIPGFYDTPNRVDGLIYRRSGGEWKVSDIVGQNSPRDLFSDSYVAETVVENLITEWENLCTCTADSTSTVSDTCVINVKESGVRSKRSSDISSSQQAAVVPELKAASSALPFAVNITADKAAEYCDTYVKAMASTSRSLTVAECSNATGILGQVDFMTQFRNNCIQYAVLLKTFNYTEGLFNSIAARCLTSLSYHVPTVLNRPTVLMQMQEEQCPSNCSGKGVCVSGICSCYTGYTGAACQTTPAAASLQPTVMILVDLYNTGVMCASDTCTVAYLTVSPYLKSANPNCLIRSSTFPYEVRSTSQALSSNIVGCSMETIHTWLRDNKKRYMALSMRLEGSDWNTNNTAKILAHQRSCRDGETVCSTERMSCTTRNTVTGSDSETNTCLPPLTRSAPSIHRSSATLTVLLSGLLTWAIQFYLAVNWNRLSD